MIQGFYFGIGFWAALLTIMAGGLVCFSVVMVLIFGSSKSGRYSDDNGWSPEEDMYGNDKPRSQN